MHNWPVIEKTVGYENSACSDQCWLAIEQMASYRQGPSVGYSQPASYWSARVHILTSIGYVLRKWPVIGKGPRVVYLQPTFGYHQGCRTVLISMGYLLRKWSVISKGLRVVYSQPTFGALGYLVEIVGLFWVGYNVREVGCTSEERMGAKLWTGLKVHKGS